MPEEPTPYIPDDYNEHTLKIKRPGIMSRWLKIISWLFAVCLLGLGLFYWYAISLNEPPENFPVDQPITVTEGMDVSAITEVMKQAGVVRSDALLYYVLALFYEPTSIKASTYIFSQPLTTFGVAERLAEGDFDTDLIRFTHFEGERATQVAKRAEEILPNFNKEAFIARAEPLEGRLFPDTYFIPADYTDEELLTLMQDTFSEKIVDLQPQIDAHVLSLDEIVILASIIEREANSMESKSMVSGILQNRLELGMPLQADASIEYILDKQLSELTPEDLKIESPYNTYLNKGLPPTPIGNPGLESIMAVLEPTQSDYYYYITGNDGEFYYAKNYAEHQRNIAKYLR